MSYKVPEHHLMLERGRGGLYERLWRAALPADRHERENHTLSG
jgi:hypothetical protein